MKHIPKVLPKLSLVPILWFSAVANAEIHNATASPSGRYRLGSDPILQVKPDGSEGDIGSTISLIGIDGVLISKCFSPSHAYIDVSPETRGTDDWQTKAYWNTAETMVAVYSGGRTWSKIDFYSIVQDRISILPHPNWHFCLFKNLRGYTGENTRLYELFGTWTGNDTFEMTVAGTAVLDEAQPERYPQFGYKVSGEVSMEGIRIIKVKEDGEQDGGGQSAPRPVRQ